MNAGVIPNTCKTNGNDGSLLPCVDWRTGEECIVIFPVTLENSGKLDLIPHTPYGVKRRIF